MSNSPVAGRYRLIEPIAEGRQGKVYQAWDQWDSSAVALKFLTEEAGNDGLRAWVGLRHPNVANVLDTGVTNGQRYLVMDYVRGPALRDAYLSGGEAVVRQLISDVCLALQASHSRGFCHGDLKPSNILIREECDGSLTAKVTDYGLWQPVGSVSEGFSGSLAYASPEVLRGEAPDYASDLYSLGACLYEVVTGAPVFERGDLHAVVHAHLTEAPAHPREAGASISDSLARVVLSLLEKEPAKRPQSAAELSHVLGMGDRAVRLGEPAWVGRRREMGFLRALGELASQGSGALALVAGAPGVGKSVLLETLQAEWGMRGWGKLHLRCERKASLVPLAEELLRRAQAAARAEGADVPGFGTDTEPGALARNFVQTVRAAASEKPVLLVLENIGRAEKNLLWLLGSLIPMLPSEHLLVVASVDSRDIDVVKGAIPHVLELPQVRTVKLRPFTAKETGDLVTSLLCLDHAEPELAALVHGACGGNPGLARGFVARLVREGFVARSHGQWVVKSLPAHGALGTGVPSLVASHLESLDAGQRKLLGVLGLIGRGVPRDLLEEVAGFDSRRLGVVLQGLEETDILKRHGDRLEIRQGLVAEAAVSALSSTEKNEAHAVAARSIRSRWPGDPDWLGPLVRHLAGCGEREEALAISLSAAEAAIRDRRYDRALALYDAADECLREQDVRERLHIWKGQASCYMGLGRWLDAVERLTTLLTPPSVGDLCSEEVPRLRLHLAAALNSLDRPADARAHLEAVAAAAGVPAELEAEALAVGAQTAAKEGRWRTAEDLARRCLEAPHTSPDPDLVAGAENTLGCALMTLGELEEAQSHLETSYRLRDERGRAFDAGRCAQNLGRLFWTLGRYEEASAHFQNALARFEGAGSVAAQARARNGLGLVQLGSGQPDRAATSFEAAWRLALGCGLWHTAGQALNNLGLALMYGGKWERALTRFRETLALGRRKGDRSLTVLGANNLGELYWRTGDLEVAQGWFAEAKRSAEDDGNQIGAGVALLGLATLCRARGELGRADGFGNDALDALERGGDARATLYAWCEVAELRLAQGKAEAAVEAAERAAAMRVETSVIEEAMVLRTLGRAMAAAGREQEASQALARCLQLLEPSGAAEELALARLEVGRWLLTTGSRPGFRAAERYLGLARDAFQKLGARRQARDAERLLSELTTTPVAGVHLPAGGAEKLSSLYKMVTLINTAETSAGLLDQVLDLAVHAVQAERGLVILVDTKTGELSVRARTEVDGATVADARRISETVVREVAGAGRPVFSPDALHDVRFSDHDSIRLHRIACFMCVPLALRGRILGTIYVDSRNIAHRFTEDDVSYLCAFAHQAAIAMENLRLREELERQNEYLQRQLKSAYAFDTLVGRSPQMQMVYRTMAAVVDAPVTVLLQGETGTGKELIARAIHYNGPRAKGRFVAVNCGAVPDSLLESELFGYTKGAFTGATKNTPGLFQLADGGTIFLDEISDMSPNLQAKLLRVLQRGEVKQLGRATSQEVDVRVISATNKDLTKEMHAGRFRKDLYYRLKVVTIQVPALRERPQDISLLAPHFLRKYNERLGKDVRAFSDDVLAYLCTRSWPGNVRELEHVIEAAVALCPGKEITLDNLSTELVPPRPVAPTPETTGDLTLRDAKNALERHCILRALQAGGWNVRKAAARLGVDRRQMQRLMRRHGLGTNVSAPSAGRTPKV